MSVMENTQQLIQFLHQFDKMYNLVRIIDPLKKQVLKLSGNETELIEESICYELWKKNSHCANCVSMRAANENDTFLKIEYNKDKIFMVLATPIVLSGVTYIVEMLKDISETGIVPDLKGKSIQEINDIIEHLNQAVITDDLTQIYNRRFINEKLPVDLYTTSLNDGVLSAMLIDIDEFKSINDANGHIMGDNVLQRAAQILKNNTRGTRDWVARYGGDEFLMVLPETDNKAAFRIAETIRQQIQHEIFELRGSRVSLTISCGVSTISETNELSATEFFEQLDKKLYEAKSKGKNTISI
ncbi:MAG: GGDEF domain-containing protein [Clostridium sp.]|uniref:GGDEF domain-containing protein n=1 Tax=Clostridium sp. TaxID=1506 RepID=UPI0029151B23|nr:GGDEF domain-containing protein [Clostridium sp.]MDU7337572.1 GGDEF domain-containing protein [Clostridium sp.]